VTRGRENEIIKREGGVICFQRGGESTSIIERGNLGKIVQQRGRIGTKTRKPLEGTSS